MKNPLFLKLITVGLLILLLLIVVKQIANLIGERKDLRQTVLQDIAKSSSASQKLVGPVLVLPYQKKIKQWKVDAETKVRYQEDSLQTGKLYFLPETFVVDGSLATETRTRGIYQARLYHADNNISGHFVIPANYGLSENSEDYQFSAPYLAMGIKDIRGIENALKIDIDGKLVDMEPGSKLDILGEGVHALISLPDRQQQSRLNFSLKLMLQGTETLSVAPVGRESKVSIKADWPHPSFTGNYLPSDHKINGSGFVANWRTSYFSSNLAESFAACSANNDCKAFNSRDFGVSLIDPVDQYVKSDRAIKYALLFIALTFAGFFLFEVLKRLAIHPVQYGLVGLALAFFYLLLVSLAEHIAFVSAYIIASAACILLLGFYVSFVLRSALRGTIFSLLLVVLYTLLFGLLSAEDYALLMGSLLLFFLLGVFMALTRKLDWYTIGRSDAQAGEFTASKVALEQPLV